MVCEPTLYCINLRKYKNSLYILYLIKKISPLSTLNKEDVEIFRFLSQDHMDDGWYYASTSPETTSSWRGV